jgi:predicted alpha/beta-fold hydrolase
MTSLFRPFPASVGLASGHLWTVSSFVTRARSVPWLIDPQYSSIDVHSDLGPPVSLRAALHEVPTAPGAPRPLLVLIHGLGGSAESGYMRDVTNAALKRNLSTLRVSLRGADEHGWDFYHAGLTDDVLRVLEAPRLAGFDSIGVFGISLGGHVTLRAAGESRLPTRVKAVAALCPPLDLEAAAAAFDTPGQWLYRRHVLRGLKDMYRRFDGQVGRHASERNLPSFREANAITRIREWDEKIVAPRHGFPNAMAYYHSQRASSRLHEVNVPSLVVTTRWDPMVPHATTASALTGASLPPVAAGDNVFRQATPWTRARVFPKLVHWELPSGGHVAWPEPRPPERSVIEHVLDWLWTPTGTD